jgi:5-methylcytosine-specific restriction endonuclease McrA
MSSPDYLTPAYFEYLNSPTWARKRRAALRRAKYKCQYCGVSGVKLEVHHLTYRNFGNEKPQDLRAACEKCHPIADNERRYNAGLHTYLTKKYGANWQDFITTQQAKGEFDLWLLSKQ